MWINYTGAPRSYPRISAADLISGNVSPEALSGKIVLIGLADASFNRGGIHRVPVGLGQSVDMFGVEIQANTLDTLLYNRELTIQSDEEVLYTTVFLAFLVALGVTLVGVGPLSALYTALLGVAFYSYAKEIIFDTRNVVPDLFSPSLAALLTYGASILISIRAERRHRRALEARFSKHVSPQLMDLLVASDDRSIVERTGFIREITVLFTDIRGFTTIVEEHPPSIIVDMLNRHFDVMVQIVFRYSGYINKYMGDGLMALYNAPLKQEDHAWRAVQTAFDLQAAARRLSRERRLQHDPFEYGFGIATGEAVVGNVGGAGRLEYTAIGDCVNLSARIVALAQPGEILIDATTYELVADRVETELLSGIRLKGKKDEQLIYKLTGLKSKWDRLIETPRRLLR
jgi:adenylate cyclase